MNQVGHSSRHSPLTSGQSASGFGTVRAMPRSGADLWVIATSAWSRCVDRAASRLNVQKPTITAGPTRERENAVLEVEVLNQARLEQTFGDLLGLFVLSFEWVHQLQAHQIGQAHLNRHGATVGHAAFTQTRTVARPGVQTVNIDKTDRGFHGPEFASRRSGQVVPGLQRFRRVHQRRATPHVDANRQHLFKFLSRSAQALERLGMKAYTARASLRDPDRQRDQLLVLGADLAFGH